MRSKFRKTVFLYILLTTICSFAQKISIKSNDDYSILEKSIERYFKHKEISDSLFFNSDLYVMYSDKKEIKRIITKRKKRDTLFIKVLADKFYYGQFLKKGANWKRSRFNKKYQAEIDGILNDSELENYKSQLADNSFIWNAENIVNKDKVFINSELQYTREEINALPEEEKWQEIKKASKLEDKINLYTFSKPIYSKDKKNALLAINSGGINTLNVFEKNDGEWVYKFSIDNSKFVDKIF